MAECTYRIGEIISGGHTTEKAPDGMVIVRNEYGREIFRCEDAALTIADWKLVAKFITDTVAAKVWMSSLQRLAGEKASD